MTKEPRIHIAPGAKLGIVPEPEANRPQGDTLASLAVYGLVGALLGVAIGYALLWALGL